MKFKKFDEDARRLVVCAMRVDGLGPITPQHFIDVQTLTLDDQFKVQDWREVNDPERFTAEAKKGMELGLRIALRAEHEFITREDILAGMQQVLDG